MAELALSFQEALRHCNPATRALLSARQLALQPETRHQDVYIEWQYGDAGPDVSAIFRTVQPDGVPPDAWQYTWRLQDGQPRSCKLPRSMSDTLTFPTLSPTGAGMFRPGLTNYDPEQGRFLDAAPGRVVTVTQAARYMLYGMPWWWRRSARVVQEYMLHQFNAAESQRLAYFLGSEKAGGDDDSTAAAADGNDAEAAPGTAAGGGAAADGAADADLRQAANAEAADRPPGPPDTDGMDEAGPSGRTRPTFIPALFHGGVCPIANPRYTLGYPRLLRFAKCSSLKCPSCTSAHVEQ